LTWCEVRDSSSNLIPISSGWLCTTSPGLSRHTIIGCYSKRPQSVAPSRRPHRLLQERDEIALRLIRPTRPQYVQFSANCEPHRSCGRATFRLVNAAFSGREGAIVSICLDVRLCPRLIRQLFRRFRASFCFLDPNRCDFCLEVREMVSRRVHFTVGVTDIRTL
jgi:hypothetical protein